MKRTKIMLLALLAALLLLPACGALPAAATPAATGAGSAGPAMNDTGYPIVKEKISLSAFQYELDNQAIDFANLWFYKQLEEKTNVHVEFEEVKEVDWTAKLNLMFASGNLSDIIMRGTLDVEEYGVVQKLLVPLDEYLPACMPAYYSRLQMNGSGSSIPASDGKSYYIGFLISQSVNTNGHWFINADWLDKLDLREPATINELTQVLRAFKNNDPNGNGLADEIPYEATFGNNNAGLNNNNTGLYNAFASWGIPENEYHVFIDKTETVRFAPFQQGYRECLEWLHTLYSEGLLDPECISQDSNLWGAKLNMGTGGYFTYWRLQNTILQEDIYKQFKCMLPVAAEGYGPAVSATLEIPDFGAAVTVANRHVRESLRWLDAQMETETMMISQNGPMGDMLKINDRGKYEVAYVPPDNGLYEIVPVICGQFFAPADYYSKIYEMAPHRVEKAGYCAWYAEAGVMEYKSFQYLTRLAPRMAEQSVRISKLYTEMDKYIGEALAGFITQGVSDESWQTFTERLAKLGADEYVAIYQNAYDKYLKSAS
jgi:putative aldouronate transport system substrate-binding protein